MNKEESPITDSVLAEKHRHYKRGETPYLINVDNAPFIDARGLHRDELQILSSGTVNKKVNNSNLSGIHCDKPIDEPQTIDSLSQLSVDESPAAIEHPVIAISVDQPNRLVKASYGNKTLVERSEGDWCNLCTLGVDQEALRAAWKTKFKEALPGNLQISLSLSGGFSLNAKRHPFFAESPWQPKRASKYAAGQRKKKKRK